MTQLAVAPASTTEFAENILPTSIRVIKQTTPEDEQLIKRAIELAEEEENTIIQKEFAKEYKKSVVYSMFAVVFLSNILINVDHGSLPGCREKIE